MGSLSRRKYWNWNNRNIHWNDERGSISIGKGAGAAVTATLDPLGEPEEGVTIDASIQGVNGIIGAKGTVGLNNKGSANGSAAVGWGIGGYAKEGALTTTVDLTGFWGEVLGFLGLAQKGQNTSESNSEENNGSTNENDTQDSETQGNESLGYW